MEWVGLKKAIAAAALLPAALLLSCNQGRKAAETGPRKTPSQPPAATTTPTATALPTPSRKPAPTPAPTPKTTPGPSSKAGPAIPADVAEIFKEMDRAFADSKAREVSIRARMELYSPIRNARNTYAIEMALQFPNLIQVRGANLTKINDPKTTTTWTQSGPLRWGVLSDGKKMLLKTGPLLITENAPKSLDDILTEQLELKGWGSNELINCFLKTHPSDAFKNYLKRARLVRRTPQEIVLELVTEPPPYVAQSKGIPKSYDVVHLVTLDARTMIPKRCYIDLADLSKMILYKTHKKNVPVSRAFLEVVVTRVNLHADFSGKNLFVLPKKPPKKKGDAATRPSLSPTTGAQPIQFKPLRLNRKPAGGAKPKSP